MLAAHASPPSSRTGEVYDLSAASPREGSDKGEGPRSMSPRAFGLDGP
jgi:hypothetical protein